MTPVTPGNILRHELIGLDVRVVDDSNPCNISITGRVIDESRNTLVIKQDGGVKRIAKQDALFQFSLPRGEVEVRGSALVGRPEDRVKRNLRRRW
jgi:ribonuclease P protein subunit POP4